MQKKLNVTEKDFKLSLIRFLLSYIIMRNLVLVHKEVAITNNCFNLFSSSFELFFNLNFNIYFLKVTVKFPNSISGQNL